MVALTKTDLGKLRTEIQTLINLNKFCWVCGREDILTEHHAIPQRFKGVKMNVKIPVCENCKSIIHENDTIISIFKKLSWM